LWKDFDEANAHQSDNWENGSVASGKSEKYPASVHSGYTLEEPAPISAYSNRISMMSNFSAVHARTTYQAPASPEPQRRGPSDTQILEEIRNILSTADLMTLTKKQVREELSKRFGGVDFKSKREAINRMIDNVLKDLQNKAEA
jgi:chitin synthase